MTEYAVLFTDVVDSTRLGERVGDARAAEIWTAHDRRARDLLALHHGREIGRGDGLFLLFDDAVEATRFALAYHLAIADLGLEARVGINHGAVSLRENPREDVARGASPLEFSGLAVQVTARLMALASGRQTLLSGSAGRALGSVLPANSAITQHGHYRLKGIAEPVEVFEIGVRGVSPFAPPADAEKAYRVVREDEAWRPVREVRHNLPAERDAFVGRTAELRALADRLDAGSRLLTILGPGGTGKTRLVRRYGRTWLGDWPGGVYFCDLSEARSLDGIHFAVASALDIPLGKDDPGAQLGHAIAGRGRCLVICDNFEQIVQFAPDTVGRWLDRAAESVFIVTSRERLHLAGEEGFPIEPLPLEMDAIQLFAARARAQRPDFVLDETNRSAVMEVARLLDGLPLAIELAAARIRVLSPAQLVERMRDRFGLLVSARGAARRQATLRAAIDWSWELLTPCEQSALAQCAVFDGGFMLEAAEAVLDLSAWPQAPLTMDVVQALVDKSLLRTWTPVARSRYAFKEQLLGMYLSIHEYAQEKLDASGTEARSSADARHGRYFAGFGTDAAIDALSGTEGGRRRRALGLELDNLVAACRRAIARGDAGIAVYTYRATWEVLALQGPYAMGTTLGAQTIGLAASDPSLAAVASLTLAAALRYAGRTDEARTWLTQALERVRALGDRRLEALILSSLGSAHREQGRMTEARELLENALLLAREVRDRSFEGRCLLNLGLLHRQQSRTVEARQHFDDAFAIAREVGNRRNEGIAVNSLGLLDIEQGLVESARSRLDAALAIARDEGDRVIESVVLANLGDLLAEQGRPTEARNQFEAALAIQRDIGDRRLEAIALGNLGAIHTMQGRCEEARMCCAGALAIAREIGNRGHQAFLLLIRGTLYQNEGRFDLARADYGAALALAREVGDRRIEGIVLRTLGGLDAEQDRIVEARANFDCALALARDQGYRQLEGAVLAGLGDLEVKQGRLDSAFRALRAGEALLREVRNHEELAKLLCLRGHAHLAAGKRAEASAALAEAESLATALNALPGSELARTIGSLKLALA